LPEALGYPSGYLIVPAKEAVNVRCSLQHDLGRLAAPLLAPLAVQQVACRNSHSVRGGFLAKPVRPPVRGQEMFGAGYMSEPTAPARDQVICRGTPSAGVVGDDGGLVIVERPSHGVDHRDAKTGAYAGPRLDPVADDHHPVHSPAQEQLHILAFSREITTGIAHECRDLAGVQCVFGA
jgi:hypothetical protein